MKHEKPELVAIGMGGRIELHPGELRIMRDGYVGFLVDLLWIANGVMEKRIPLSDITSMEVVRPMILPNYFRVSYAGSPPQSGSYLTDALAENAVIMNPLDHRAFYALQDRVIASRRSEGFEAVPG
jgi:hypothetical protein